MLKQIQIQDLQPGMVIVRITAQNGPVKIKKAGLVTSLDMVQGLIEMGIQQVEVDPDQTVEVDVEVDTPTIKKSATIRMLESNKVTHTRIDDGLSEQFHRSLFLPSVQDIPSVWQFYTKRYLLAVFIAIGGLSLGWTLANYQQILTLLSPKPDTPVASVSAPVPAVVTLVTVPRDNKTEPSVKVDKPQNTHAEVIEKTPVQKVAAIGDIETSSVPNDVIETTTSAPEPEPQISADVLARFRKAITEVADSPDTPAPIESVPSSADVPRIDQLPAWVMTRLPSMAFSVHMYASIESERWVRVNGTRMVEGDKIDGSIEIVRIEPQHVILNYSGQTFSMAALTDW
jgi:general secretion pathway protein B